MKAHSTRAAQTSVRPVLFSKRVARILALAYLAVVGQKFDFQPVEAHVLHKVFRQKRGALEARPLFQVLIQPQGAGDIRLAQKFLLEKLS